MTGCSTWSVSDGTGARRAEEVYVQPCRGDAEEFLESQRVTTDSQNARQWMTAVAEGTTRGQMTEQIADFRSRISATQHLTQTRA